MFDIIQPNLDFTPEFISYAAEMNNLQQAYTTHKTEANKLRMLMIGRSEEVKSQYKRGSKEFQYIQQGYKSNDWSQDVIDNSRQAYRCYKELNAKEVPEYKALAEAASPTQLLQMSKADDSSTLIYDAARHFKKTGSVPSSSALQNHLKGNRSNTFEKTVSIRQTPNEPTINLVDNNTVSVSATEVVNTATPETTTIFKTQQEAIAELVSDDTKPYLNDLSSAGVYHAGGRISSVRACTQHITEMSIMSPEMAKAVDELFHAVISLKGRSPALVEYNDMPIRGRR
jgi:hypothetical protein